MIIGQRRYSISTDTLSLRLACMSIINVQWSCIYSRAGIMYSSGDRLPREASSCNSRVSYMRCLYKKSKPVFSKPEDPSHSKGSLSWDDKSFSKFISPDSQAMAILSMCSCSRRLYPGNIPLGSCLVKSAALCSDFTSTCMRNSEGLFIAVEDKTKAAEKEPKLKPCSKNAHLHDQVLMYEALLCLYKVTSDESMKEYSSPKAPEYRQDALSLYDFIQRSLEDLLSCSSKEISICISSLSRCMGMEEDESLKEELKRTLFLLCAELETRIKITGQADSYPDSLKECSLATHLKVSSAMFEGYNATGILKFRELGTRVYDYLEDLYSPNLKLYIEEGQTKVTCSIRDIADMLKLQLLKYSTEGDAKAEERLKEMYTELIENSSIMQSLPDKSYSLKGESISLPDAIPDTRSTRTAPVFVKSIKLNLKKDSIFKPSKHFNSLYSLYASYTFLSYFEKKAPDKADNGTLMEEPVSLLDAASSSEISDIPDAASSSETPA